MKKMRDTSFRPLIISTLAIVGILIVAAFITVKINNSGSQNINVNSVKISSRALKSLPIRSDNTFQVDANLSKITFDNKEKLTNMSNENLKRLNYIQFAALILNFGKNELRNQDYQQMWNVAIKSKQLKVSIIPDIIKNSPFSNKGTIYQMQTTSGLRLSYTINKNGDTVLFGRGKNINEIAQIGKFRINRIVASANQDENRLAVKAMLKYCLGA